MFTDLVREFGVGVAIVIAIFTGGGYILYRLFAKQDGILTIVSQRHIQFIDVMQEQQTKLTSATEQLATSSKVASENIQMMSASRDNLHRAASHACDYLEQVAKSLDIEDQTRASINNIRSEISSH